MPSLQGLSNFILKPKVVETIEMIAEKVNRILRLKNSENLDYPINHSLTFNELISKGCRKSWLYL